MKDFNFIPEYVVEEQQKSEVKKLIKFAGIIFILCVIIIFGFPLFQLYSLKNTYEKLTKEVQDKEKINEVVVKYKSVENEIKNRENLEETLQKEERRVLKILDIIQKNIPKRVTILNLSFKKETNELNLIGYARDEVAIADFINNLSKVESFVEIKPENKLDLNTDNISFSISLKYKPKE